jgi:hypothetical protein
MTASVSEKQQWKSYKTIPKNERVLVCYLNLWGYNHVTEAYWDEHESWPVTANRAVLNVPFLWTELPEGPKFPEFYKVVMEMP